jgi:glycosyltransferase involved in cell wall biosynthesis
VAAPGGVALTTAEEIPGVRALRLPRHETRPRSWFAGSRAIARFVADGPGPDLVHANGLSALNLVAPLALRRRIPVFVHFHGSETGTRARTLAKLWRGCGLRMTLHPVSEQARSVLVDAGLGSTVGAIVPNPIDLPREPFRLRSEALVRVGFVGSVSRLKGLHVLVDVARRLTDEPVRWVINGIAYDAEAPYVRGCRAKLDAAGLTPRVEWRGVVDDMEDAYREMDVLLVPSLQESWCRVAMEGMAMGLAVVASDIPGLRELTGLVPGALTFAPDRPDVAELHLRRLVHEPDRRRELGTAGREAMRAFDSERVAAQVDHLYKELLVGGRANVTSVVM